MCCSAEDVGAYYHIIPEANMGMGFAYWATNHPFGDAFILLSQPRIKKAVPAVQFNIVESFDAQTKSYYIPEPLWDMIKKYAGIYNYNINWGKKWSDISSYYVFKECCPHVGEMTQKAFCKLGKENPDDMRRLIWKDLNNHFNLKSVWVGLEDGVQIHLKNVNSKEIGFRKLEYKFPLFKLPDWIKVGTEVSWSANKYANDQHKCCGKVVKITPKNISIDIYDVLEDKREHVGYGDIHIHYKWGPILRRSTFSVDKGFKLKDSDGWVYVVYYN